MIGDRISGFFWFLFGLFILKESFRLKTGVLSQPGPGFFSLLGGILLLVCTTILFLQSILFKSRAVDSKEQGEKKNHQVLIYLFVALLAYALLFEFLGFILCTFFIVLLIFGLFEHKKWWSMLITAALVSLASYTIFTFLLKSELPKGVLGLF
ncbi:tripartite tricarboxylate transporter TctB family protein [Thermodesulfobacteriota bacterium]